MKRNVRRTYLPSGRWQPRCETLEERLVLTALAFDPSLAPRLPSVQIDATRLLPLLTWPSDGSVIKGSVTSFAVGFNVPLNEISISQDFVLCPVRSDGGIDLENQVPIIMEQLDATDARWLVASLDQPLEPGTYRILLSDSSTLRGTQGARLDTFGEEVSPGDFTVGRAGTVLDDAIDLGVIGPTVRGLNGTIDLQSDPAQVGLARFSLPDNASLWRLGLELDTERSGSPLRATLSLFDADGNLVATSRIGRPDFPNDPYLFAGLRPGIYYVAVSAANNQPGRPGGYNLTTGEAGTNPANQPGGAYTLRLAADAVTKPTSVIDFQLDHADPALSIPTGFQIQFSGPIAVMNAGGQIGPVVNHGLEVVDESGRSWNITAVGYDEATCRLTFVFNDPLPPGTYSVRLPNSGGLADLAGQRVVRSIGSMSAPLATFKADSAIAKKSPNDLGLLFAGTMPANGFQRMVVLQPGEAQVIRLTTLATNYLSLEVAASGGQLAIDLFEPESGTCRVLHRDDVQKIAYRDHVYLTKGIQLIRLRATGDRPVRAQLVVSPDQLFESLLLNGVGQSPSLSLRMVAPTPVLVATPNTTAPEVVSESTAPVTSPITAVVALFLVSPQVSTSNLLAGDSSSAVAFQLGTASGGLTLSLASTPVGLPGSSAGHNAAAHSGGPTSLASDGSLPFNNLLLNDITTVLAPDVPNEVPVPTDGGLVVAAVFEREISDTIPEPVAEVQTKTGDQVPDVMAVTAQNAVQRWWSPTQVTSDSAAEGHPSKSLSPVHALATPAAPTDPEPTEALSLDPIGLIGILTLSIYPFRNQLSRWFGRPRFHVATSRRNWRPQARTGGGHSIS